MQVEEVPLSTTKERFLYPCGEGLNGRGYQNCEAMTGYIVLSNVSTLMHVFSAILT